VTDTLDGVPLLSETVYADLRVGQRFGPFREPLARATSDGLRGAVGDDAPGAHAPGGVLPLVTLRALRRALDGIPPGGVLMNQRFAVHAALPAEADLDVDVRVADMAERRGHLETTFVFRVEHDGDLAAVVDWTIRAA
jgi:hypothetical protein